MNPLHFGMTGFPHEAAIRAGFFVLILAAVALSEMVAPRRLLTVGKAGRWRVNLAISVIDTVAVYLLFPVLPVGLAVICAAKGWGVLNHFPVPFWAAVTLGVLLFDLIIYLQHAMFHMIPLFWRIHRVHHTDLDIDVTSGLRFHPLEILLSMLIKLAAVAALGVPALAVLIFEVLLNGTSLFNHGNIGLPAALDGGLRLVVVTPDMHRVHHSVVIRETNSNFGFNFPWWDRLFGTYRPQPVAGHGGMVIGLAEFRDARALTLLAMLALPFRLGKGGSGGRAARGPVSGADQPGGGDKR